jgi:hypothetical protein
VEGAVDDAATEEELDLADQIKKELLK